MIKRQLKSSAKAAGRTIVFDSAPLVDYYITGHFTDLAQDQFAAASRVGVSRLVLPEAFAAINARLRDKKITRTVAQAALSAIEKDWKGFVKIAASVSVCSEAATLTSNYPLKGADSVHLAGFLYFLNFDPNALFFTTDKQLYRAAKQLGPVVRIPGW